MQRVVNDQDYITCLPSEMYRQRYNRWRTSILSNIENIVFQLSQSSVEEVMEQNNLTARDVALMVRLGYFTSDEVESYGLSKIESQVPSGCW